MRRQPSDGREPTYEYELLKLKNLKIVLIRYLLFNHLIMIDTFISI